jgi:hypothetical protein
VTCGEREIACIKYGALYTELEAMLLHDPLAFWRFYPRAGGFNKMVHEFEVAAGGFRWIFELRARNACFLQI